MIIVLELYRILCQLCCCFSSIFFVWNYGFTLNYYYYYYYYYYYFTPLLFFHHCIYVIFFFEVTLN